MVVPQIPSVNGKPIYKNESRSREVSVLLFRRVRYSQRQCSNAGKGIFEDIRPQPYLIERAVTHVLHSSVSLPHNPLLSKGQTGNGNTSDALEKEPISK